MQVKYQFYFFFILLDQSSILDILNKPEILYI